METKQKNLWGVGVTQKQNKINRLAVDRSARAQQTQGVEIPGPIG